jgi:membrane fusion protein, multidrug efflux system
MTSILRISRAPVAALVPFFVFSGGCKKAEAPETTAAADPVIHVATVEVTEKPMPNFLPLTGTLDANQSSYVAADTSGKILITHVERGSFVDKGAVLASVDRRTAALMESEATASAAAARTQAEQAQKDCERNEKLFEEGAISKAEHDRQRSACEVTLSQARAAEVRVRSAQKGIGDTSIRAPFSGMVAERYVSAGEYVTPPTKVAQVVEIDPLRLQLSVPESGVKLVRMGLSVDFHVAAYPEETFHGTIRYIGPALRSSSRDLLVEAVVPNGDHRLRPGMFASAELSLGDHLAPVIPKDAVRIDGSLNRIFVVKNKQIEERLAKLGDAKDGLIVIEQGASPGDRVVAPLTKDVRDGARVD